MIKITDPVIGKLVYRYSWRKKESIECWGQRFIVDIIIKAYSPEDEILDSQRLMFQDFRENISEKVEEALPQLHEYFNKVVPGDSIDEDIIADALKPTSVVFLRNETWGIVFDCPWDEHDVVLVVKQEKFEVLPAEVFL